MAIENVDKFEELLRNDEALKAKLDAAVAAFKGNVEDNAEVFAGIIIPLAEEVGLPFTYEEATEFSPSRELSADELDAVAGGDWGFCILIGVGDHPDSTCREPGYACAYIGVGAGGEINE